jgi:hypothetical protein
MPRRLRSGLVEKNSLARISIMTRIRCILALLVGVTLTADASAQFLPIFNLPTVVQPGIDFRIGGRRLWIDGFILTGDPYTAIVPVVPTPFGLRQVGPAFVPYSYAYRAYGSVDQRITVRIINPPTVSRRVGLKPTYDLSGIDLDVEPASKIWGPKPNALAKEGKGKQGEKEEKKVEIAAANPAKAPAVVPPPKVEKVPEGRRLHDLGVAAFGKGEYGLALLRFRQAVDVEPPEPRALFLRGQACIAVGKYRDAAEIIQRGLQILPDWPISGFRPRVELYPNQDDLWTAHRKRLEDAQRLEPKNADDLFLLGYLAWFDGQRAAAVDYFQQARALAAEPRWSDAFLKVAKK